MQSFIRSENIALFRRRLADFRTTERERMVLLKLLAEEEMKGCTGQGAVPQAARDRSGSDASIQAGAPETRAYS